MLHGVERTAGVQDILRRLLIEPTVSIDDTARLLGVGRSTVYAVARSGEVPVIRVRSRLRVPSRWVRQRLHLEGEPDAVGPSVRPPENRGDVHAD
ncbi:helix-turn-helix domain-containing protein [Nocardia sp. 2YAB30]|uniref:helix-turn-helix domain-containing protein n=1 Tax=unclassified Nocardia TaxID=2637762 RepID=UPI003F985ADC